jgi:hypothetical protein
VLPRTILSAHEIVREFPLIRKSVPTRLAKLAFFGHRQHPYTAISTIFSDTAISVPGSVDPDPDLTQLYPKKRKKERIHV